MVTTGRDERYELVGGATESSPLAGIAHGLVFVVPLWTLVASVIVVAVVR